MLVKVKDSNFVRDTESMALINIDSASKDEYYAKVRLINTQKQDINRVNEEIAGLKSELGEIKQLLLQITSK